MNYTIIKDDIFMDIKQITLTYFAGACESFQVFKIGFLVTVNSKFSIHDNVQDDA